jgi:hypothetical protein
VDQHLFSMVANQAENKTKRKKKKKKKITLLTRFGGTVVETVQGRHQWNVRGGAFGARNPPVNGGGNDIVAVVRGGNRKGTLWKTVN